MKAVVLACALVALATSAQAADGKVAPVALPDLGGMVTTGPASPAVSSSVGVVAPAPGGLPTVGAPTSSGGLSGTAPGTSSMSATTRSAAGGEGPAGGQLESDGLQKRNRAVLKATGAETWTLKERDSERHSVTLGDLLQHQDGRGLETIRLRGRVSGQRIIWIEAVRVRPTAGAQALAGAAPASGAAVEVVRRAPLREVLWSRRPEGGTDSAPPAGADLAAEGAVNPMIRIARSLLGDDAEKDGQDKAKSADGLGAGAGSGGGKMAGGQSNGGGSSAGMQRTATSSSGGAGTSPGYTSPTGTGTTGTTTTTTPGTVGGTTTGTGTTPTGTTTTTTPGTVGGTTTGTGTTPTGTTTTTTPGTVGGTTSGTGAGGTGTVTPVTLGGGTGGTGTGSSGSGTSPVTGGTSPVGGGTPGATDPDPNALPAQPVVSFGEQACPDRVALPQMQVYTQSAETRYENGALVSTSACSDGLHTMQVKYLEGVCPDEIDAAAGFAYDRATQYYVRTTGEVVEVAGCGRYQNRAHRIQASAEGCGHQIDLNAGVARIQTRQVYSSKTGETVQVASCAASGSAVPIQWTAGGCTYRHDVSAGRTYTQQRPYYTVANAEHRAGGCEDRGAVYTHAVTESGCSPIVNDTSHTVTPVRRTVVSLPEGVAVVVDCTPAGAASMARDRCVGEYAHLPGASVSYAMYRYSYSAAGSTQVSGCMPDTGTGYPHQQKALGWTYDDAGLRAQQRVQRYVDTPDGQVAISTTEGAWVGYSYVSEELRANIAAQSYDGCNRMVPTTKWITYQRPDGSTVSVAAGAGPTAVSQDGCSPATTSTQWVSDEYRVKSGSGNSCVEIFLVFRDALISTTRVNGAGQTFSGDGQRVPILIRQEQPQQNNCPTTG